MDDAWALEHLGDADAAGSNRIEIDGVTIDVMPTTPLPADDAELPEADLHRLFVLGHRWALETAEPLAVRVVGAHPGEATSDTLTVATATALVACEFHAITDRHGARRDKQESDAVDLFRLLGDLVRSPEPAVAFAAAPFDLAALVAAQIDDWFIGGSLRTARLISLGQGAGGERIEPVDVATLGRLARDLLAS